MDINVKKSITTLSSDGATLAKIIATFCVVLTHSYKIFKYMEIEDSTVFYLRGFHAFASCGVPVFFLLSGYFLTFKDNWDYSKNIKKKLKSLVIPYCLFIVFYTIVSCIGSLVLPGFFDNFKEFTVYDWIMHLLGIPFVSGPEFYGPLWFVRDLIIFNILSIILVPTVKRIPGYLLITAMIVFYFLPIVQIARYAITFFIIGMFLGFNKKIPILKKPIHILILFIIGFFVPIIFQGTLAWKISVLFMCFTILSLSEIIVTYGFIQRRLQTVIQFSFPIYLIHEYPITALMRLLALKNIDLPWAIVAFGVAPFIIIFICILLIIVWKRLLPKMFYLFTGGR